MTQYVYCELSDLETNQCGHCRYQQPNLGPAHGGLLDEEEDDAAR